jgi:hypothetical protein
MACLALLYFFTLSHKRKTATAVIKPDGWMDGWMDRWMDGWMDGWMDLISDTTFEKIVTEHKINILIFLNSSPKNFSL